MLMKREITSSTGFLCLLTLWVLTTCMWITVYQLGDFLLGRVALLVPLQPCGARHFVSAVGCEASGSPQSVGGESISYAPLEHALVAYLEMGSPVLPVAFCLARIAGPFLLSQTPDQQAGKL